MNAWPLPLTLTLTWEPPCACSVMSVLSWCQSPTEASAISLQTKQIQHFPLLPQDLRHFFILLGVLFAGFAIAFMVQLGRMGSYADSNLHLFTAMTGDFTADWVGARAWLWAAVSMPAYMSAVSPLPPCCICVAAIRL